MKQYYLILVAFLGVVFLTSCDSNRYFEQNLKLNNERWHYSDTRTFSFDLTDTLSLFNFYVNVRNTNEYPYANLYIFINSEFPNGEKARDTIELQLAQIDGKWLGSGSGKYKYNQFVLRKGMRFVQTGKYSFGIEHGMRTDTLTGISDIGIRLEYE